MRKLLFLFLCAMPMMAQHNGTTVGTPTFGAAKFGNGLTATTDANYITLPTGTATAASTSTSSFTVEAQLQISGNPSANAVAVAFGSFSPNNLVLLYVDTNGHLFSYATGSTSGGAGIANDSGVTVTDGARHHCELDVTSGTSWVLFVDGVKATTVTATSYTGFSAGTGGFLGRNATTGAAFPGKIDEVAIWHSVRHTASFTAPTAGYVGTEGMDGLYHLQSDGTDNAGTATATTVDPSSASILYSPFNWSAATGTAKTINAGAYFRTIFSGTSVKLSFDTSANGSPFPEFWAKVDNQGWMQFQLAPGSPTITIATGLLSRKHTLDVVVKSFTSTLNDWSAPAMFFNLTGLVLDTGATLTMPQRKTKNILVYGDSITAGHCTVTCTGVEVDANDSIQTWVQALANAVDAEVGIVGFGGTGILTTGDGNVPPLPSTYNSIYSGVSRSFTTPAPDLVIYNEGTNDGSANIVSAYTGVVNAIAAAAPSAKHLLLRPFGGNQAANVQATATAMGAKATYVDTTGWYNTADSYDSIHPYGYASYNLIGPKLLPYVASALYPLGRSYSYF